MELSKSRKKQAKTAKEITLLIKKWREAIEQNDKIIPTLGMLYNNIGLNASLIFRIKYFNKLSNTDIIDNTLKQYITVSPNNTNKHNNTNILNKQDIQDINNILHNHNIHITHTYIYIYNNKSISIPLDWYINRELLLSLIEFTIQELIGIYDYRVLNGEMPKYAANYAVKYREYLTNREHKLISDISPNMANSQENTSKSLEIEIVGVKIPQEQQTSKLGGKNGK